MDIRKGNDVNIYFELSKLGVPSAESIKGIRCFFAKDVRSESGDVPVPPSCNPSSYVIHDHMHPCYNVHMPYLNIDRHVHREFSVPCSCVPGWYNPNIFFTTDYKIVDIEKEGQDVSFLKTVFDGSKQRNGRYNVILEIAFVEQGVEDGTQTKCTFDYGHQFDITDQPDAASGIVNIWIGDDRDVSVRLDEEILRATTAEEELSAALDRIDSVMDHYMTQLFIVTDADVTHEDIYLELSFPYYMNHGDGWDHETKTLTLNSATQQRSGVMSAEDKTKLNTLCDNVYIDQNGKLNLSNVVYGLYVDAYEINTSSTHDMSILSVNGSILVSAMNSISLSSSEGGISLTAGDNSSVILTSDTSVNLTVGNTSLTLDESKLQRLAQLLA